MIDESISPVKFKSTDKCQVASGEWYDPFTGETITDATKLDVDHMVPLKNAHDSGGWKWDNQKKSETDENKEQNAESNNENSENQEQNTEKNQSISEGWGKSIKQAEKDAASKALKYFEKNVIDQ